MPTGRQWFRFLSGATLIMGTGIIFLKYFVPSDEKIVNSLSPELKAQYEKSKEIRHRADQLLQEAIAKNTDKPAWLQGPDEMRKLDKRVLDQAREEIEQKNASQALSEERKRFAELAKKEK